MKQKRIRYTILLCRGLIGLALLFYLVFFAGIVHWHFVPEFYRQVDVQECFKAGFGLNDIRICGDCNHEERVLRMSMLRPGMIYWLLLRGSFFFGITILILQRLLKILQSIDDLQTFLESNIRHFKVLALYGWLAFAMSSFNFYIRAGQFDLHFTMAFGPLLFALSCWVLAQVFEEGYYLQEDSNAII